MDFYNSLSPQRPHTQDHHLVPSLTTSNTTSAYSHSTTRSSESSSRPSGQHGLSFETQHRISHESKPRLSKDQQDVLEKHFQDQPKPSTQTKKVFSESLNVPLDKINVSFESVSTGRSLSNLEIRLLTSSIELVPKSTRKSKTGG